MIKRNLVLWSCILFNAVLFAQDTVVSHHDMKQVDIIQPLRIRYIQSGVRQDVPDSTVMRINKAGTLTDLLGATGSMNVKNTGAGGLTTMAIRGANSMQTPIVWNGINLQNINNNTVDLSLIPVFLFDQVSVQAGSSSAKWGSGAIGGVIRLSSSAAEIGINQRWLRGNYNKNRVVFEMGSFGANTIGFQYAGGKGKLAYDLKGYRQYSNNNFSFINTGFTGGIRDTLMHAQQLQIGFLSEVMYLSDVNSFSLAMWVQETNREIAPTMLQSDNQSTQQDYALRIVGSWSYSRWPLMISSRAAVIHEGLVYDPGYTSPINNTNAWTALIESEIGYFTGETKRKLWRRINTSGGINFTYSGAEVTESIPYKEQFRLSVYAGLSKYLREQDEFNLSLRGEMVNGKLVEPVGNIWYTFWWKEWIGLKSCVSKSYRIPTFNDLYWTPGGNRDLLPESSWTEELTLVLRKKRGPHYAEYSVTGYNRNVKDMITWIPSSSYWSPMNVNRVWSRGIEQRGKYKLLLKNWKITFYLNVDYVRSTSEKSNVVNDVSLGKQMIYVPAWFGGTGLTVQYKKYYITYSHQYTDLRFTTRDHLEWLPAYSLDNIALGYTQTMLKASGNYAFNFYAKCNNVFDVSYQSVAWRPMPGINFQIGCTIDFDISKTE